jgi:hypothetical protein
MPAKRRFFMKQNHGQRGASLLVFSVYRDREMLQLMQKRLGNADSLQMQYGGLV